MLKWAVIALLVGNVSLFALQFNEGVGKDPTRVQGVPPLPLKTPGLRLISELPNLPSRRELDDLAKASTELEGELVSAADLSTEINDIGKASNSCVDIGPLPDAAQLKDLRAWLSTRATTVHSRVETTRERRFFWVYLEPASDAEAQANLSDLARRGVTDYMLIRRGGLKNAISLGLFRSQDSVNRRLAEMTQQGYKPVVVPKFESTKSYYLRATLVEGAEDVNAIPAKLYGDAILEGSDCTSLQDPAVTAKSR